MRSKDALNVPQDPKQPTNDQEANPATETGAPPAREAGAAGAPAEVRPELARAEAERDELRQMLIRRQADFDNFRKRVERERHEDRERAVAALAESILPVLDNFERALAAGQDPAYREHRRGFEMIYRQLAELLAKHGITRMESPVGKPFDPHSQHAVERVETSDQPADTVLEEVLAGYKFHHRVLRPAQVRVAGHPARHSAEATPKAH
jgi:molecular chaperone GrpE